MPISKVSVKCQMAAQTDFFYCSLAMTKSFVFFLKANTNEMYLNIALKNLGNTVFH